MKLPITILALFTVISASAQDTVKVKSKNDAYTESKIKEQAIRKYKMDSVMKAQKKIQPATKPKKKP